jgi:TetR/AcrR family transcriptional regulator, mexJK operon transcriptional repressor
VQIAFRGRWFANAPKDEDRMEESRETVKVAEPGYEPRERGLKRRDLFLDAAMEVFVERGFEAASLQEIVARAGGSLATLYRLFGNKEGLFQAVIERKAHSVFGALDVPRNLDREPAEVLREIGSQLLDLILSPEAIGVHRLIISEAAKNPQLRETFMALGPRRVYEFLADYFSAQTKAGRLAVGDPSLATVQFLEMIKGDYYMRRLLGEEVRLSAKERRRVVDHAVGIFLQGVSSEQ